MLYEGLYPIRDSYMGTLEEPDFWPYYDGGCGPKIPIEDLPRLLVKNYRDTPDYQAPHSVRISWFKRCGHRNVSMHAYNVKNDSTYEIHRLARFSMYPYGNVTWKWDEDLVGQLQCDSSKESAAVCFENSNSTELWLDCGISYRVYICEGELCNGFAGTSVLLLCAALALMSQEWSGGG